MRHDSCGTSSDAAQNRGRHKLTHIGQAPPPWRRDPSGMPFHAQRLRSQARATLDGALKRTLDVVVAGSLLLILAPVIAVIAATIKLESRGSFLYRCRRVGREGSELQMLKFRKMHDGARGPALVVPKDERFTRIGPKQVRWAVTIEDHYSAKRGTRTFMDIEWAQDGLTGELFILQARPETVHGGGRAPTLRMHRLKEHGKVLTEGLAVGNAVASGPARVLRDPSEIETFRQGEVLVTEITDPDWEPIMKAASAIVTERGGRTSHAAIVARELGIAAVVGAQGATRAVKTGEPVTVSCCEGEVGRVYDGLLDHEVTEIDPEAVGRPKTKVMMNVANPERAFELAQIPNDGVGLARMEFVFAGWVGVHPLALTRYDSLPPKVKLKVSRLTRGYEDKSEFFVDRLSQGIGTLAAAFWPRPVILRFSDFKTNEYAHLLGGDLFEPHEENPMLGWRGSSRYYHPDYKEGFMLEVRTVRRVREEFGLKNLKVMFPFCRTPEEGMRVLEVMREGGLSQGTDGLEVYVMAEIPSNVVLAEEFAAVFDGFSIGSNDLTQLVLGVDRDSERVAPLFDERNEAVRRMCATLIENAHRAGRKVGICGQAPSDYPEFAAFLVERGIDSVSLSPDAVVPTTLRILETERAFGSASADGGPHESEDEQ